MLLIAAKNSQKLLSKLTQTKFSWKASAPCEKKLAISSVKIKTAITHFSSSKNSILPYNSEGHFKYSGECVTLGTPAHFYHCTVTPFPATSRQILIIFFSLLLQ